MTDNELLLALRNELQPIKEQLKDVQNDIRDFKIYVENEIEPKIQLLAENYVPAAKRYERTTPEIEEMKKDIDIMKKVIAEHSEKLQKISQGVFKG